LSSIELPAILALRILKEKALLVAELRMHSEELDSGTEVSSSFQLVVKDFSLGGTVCGTGICV